MLFPLALAVGSLGLVLLLARFAGQPPSPLGTHSVSGPSEPAEGAVSLAPPDAPGPALPPSEVFERVPAGIADFSRTSAHLSGTPGAGSGAPWQPDRLVDWFDVGPLRPDLAGPLRVEYSMDVELTRRIFRVLRAGRVARGHVIVLEPDSGRVLAYASTAPDEFPATRAYPAASLVKVITAAAALDSAPEQARALCRYRGSPYRLTPSRVYRPSIGREITLERSLATSNNQCLAQLAVNAVGADALLAAVDRFGWRSVPAAGHAPGSATAGDDDYDLGRLGCGLAGCRITPLHAAQLAASLARGELVDPWWIERVVDVHGRAQQLPLRRPHRQIMTPELADELREMLVRTTTRGTARSAFRDRRGRPRLGEIRVAAKTGNLSGGEPSGRYEWFIGVAPAKAPTVAVAVLQLQADLWWVRSSEIAADVLAEIFCAEQGCRSDLAARFIEAETDPIAPRREPRPGWGPG
jgi:peptidoglycan glycosyltransferase